MIVSILLVFSGTVYVADATKKWKISIADRLIVPRIIRKIKLAKVLTEQLYYLKNPDF